VSDVVAGLGIGVEGQRRLRVTTIGVRVGLAPRESHLLTVVGRKTGTPHTTPVSLVLGDGERWLVSTYGDRAWVLNLRAAGEAQLRRGRRQEFVLATEADAKTPAPILRGYLERNAITRPFFDVTLQSSHEEFVAEATRHPVFRLESRR
jgi:deazaflavin-dependent oxidoreductase (nitroreductase family)